MPNEVVLAPSIELPPHGLVASGNVVEDDGGRWENGITFSPAGCYRLFGDCSICNDAGQRQKSALQQCSATAVFKPYVLDLGVVWNTPDRFDIKEFMRTQLDVGTSAKLEELSWVGCTGSDNPTLNEGAVIGSGNAVAALSATADAIATGQAGLRIGGHGTIHLSYATANLAVQQLDYDNDGKLRTRVGHHRVIVGNYPDDRIAGHLGDIDVYLGEVFLTDAGAEIRARNEMAVRVERVALAAWNVCAAYLATVTP
jgi:hypothetical protein